MGIHLLGVTGTDLHLDGAWIRNEFMQPFVATKTRQVLRVSGDGQAPMQAQSEEVLLSLGIDVRWW
jgi:hypothetical protein